MPSTIRERSHAEPRSRWADTLLCVAFVGMLVTPMAVQVGDPDNAEVLLTREQRSPSPTPELPHDLASWRAFPVSVDEWYGERFGFRNQLLYASQWLRTHAFGLSPAENTLVGPNGWLFVGNHEVQSSYRGANPFTQAELDQWHESIEGRRDWVASRGIDYALVLVPIKQEVYPEELPQPYRKVAENRRDQLLAELSDVPELLVIDLLPPLLAAKEDDGENDHLFYPLGGHWTDRGALEGYRAILSRLPERHQNRRLLDLNDFERVGAGRQDDLSRQFLIDGGFRQAELHLRQITAHPTRYLSGVREDGTCGLSIWRHENRRRSTAYVQRDSFGAAVLPYIAQHFSDLTDVSSLLFTPALIESIQPDLVIEMFVDRALSFQTPHVQQVFEPAELARRFVELPQTLLSATPNGTVPKLRGLLGTDVHESPEGVRLDVDGASAVQLPPFRYAKGALTILRVDITAPAATVLTIYDPIPGERVYREKQSSRLPLHAGRQVVYLELPPQQVDTPLALVPGCAPGSYWIHDIEARSDAR